jgi:hypothetical protein
MNIAWRVMRPDRPQMLSRMNLPITGVDVLHLVGSRRAQPDLRFHGMHAEPEPAPAVLPDEAVPGGG